MRLNFSTLLLIVLVGAVACWVTAPWFAFRSMRDAARTNDVAALTQIVDYNAVRAGLSDQLSGRPIAQAPAPDIWHDPLGALKHAFTPPAPTPPALEGYVPPGAWPPWPTGGRRDRPCPRGARAVSVDRLLGPRPLSHHGDRPRRAGRKTEFTSSGGALHLEADPHRPAPGARPAGEGAMMNRILAGLGILVVLLIGAAYVGSPLLAFEQLRQAARAGDHDRLEALVDFPAVRENLKHQVDNRVTKLARHAGGIGFLPLQVLSRLGVEVGDRAVDRLVTPEAIGAMAAYGERPRGQGAGEGGGGGTKVVTHFALSDPRPRARRRGPRQPSRLPRRPDHGPPRPVLLARRRHRLPGKDDVDVKDLY